VFVIHNRAKNNRLRASGAVWCEASFIHRLTATLRTGIVDNL